MSQSLLLSGPCLVNEGFELALGFPTYQTAPPWGSMHFVQKLVIVASCRLVSVSYCCVTNHNKLDIFMQHIFIIFSFCGSGIWALLSWVPCSRLLGGSNQHVHRTMVSSQIRGTSAGLEMGQPPSSGGLRQVQFFLVGRPRSCFLCGCWLGAALSPLPCGLLNMAICPVSRP